MYRQGDMSVLLYFSAHQILEGGAGSVAASLPGRRSVAAPTLGLATTGRREGWGGREGGRRARSERQRVAGGWVWDVGGEAKRTWRSP